MYLAFKPRISAPSLPSTPPPLLSLPPSLQIEEKDEAYLKLLAKHTLQSGLSAKTAQENERLRAEAEALRKENTRLAEQVRVAGKGTGGGQGRGSVAKGRDDPLQPSV